MEVVIELVAMEELSALDLQCQRIFREQGSLLDIPDADFQDRYHLTREKFYCLLQMVENDLQHKMDRNRSLSPAIQLSVALRFYATGLFQ